MPSVSRSMQPMTSCCRGITLRTGCLILAYFNLLLDVCTIVGVVLFGKGFADGRFVPIDMKYFIILSVLWITISIVCLIGLHKRSLGFVKVYIGIAGLGVIVSVVNIVQLIAGGKSIILNCIGLAFHICALLVYYAYAKQLKREKYEVMA